MAKNCIENTNDQRKRSTFASKQLRAVQYRFDQAFQVVLENGEVLYVEKVLRVVPRRRMVVYGFWRDKSVVAKLFFHDKHAKRHLQQEEAGVAILRQNNIPTPNLYYAGKTDRLHTHVIIFEYIEQAMTLETLWREKSSANRLMPRLQAVVIELATQHVLGILQRDLHMKNFLLTEKTIYTLDAAQISLSHEKLDKATSMKSLALFLSQLGVGVEKYQEQLFVHYAKARGWLIKVEDHELLFALIREHHQARWKQYQKKIYRNCTSFASFRQLNAYGMYDRDHAGPELMYFMRDPESAFHHGTTKILKSGRSSTVVSVVLDKHHYVVKRYNLKSTWHRLRRMVRNTRAIKAWHFGHKLRLFYVPTPKPIAVIEKRWLGFRGIGYIVMEHIDGMSADKWLKQHAVASDYQQLMVTRLVAILYNLARLEMTHGDLKLTNFLINSVNQPVLIDFDGAAEHASLPALRRGWSKEIVRFLDNFQQMPQLLQKFKEVLQ